MSRYLLEHLDCGWYAWGKPVGPLGLGDCPDLENYVGEPVPAVVVVVDLVVVARQGLEGGLEPDDELPQRVSSNEVLYDINGKGHIKPIGSTEVGIVVAHNRKIVVLGITNERKGGLPCGCEKVAQLGCQVSPNGSDISPSVDKGIDRHITNTNLKVRP